MVYTVYMILIQFFTQPVGLISIGAGVILGFLFSKYFSKPQHKFSGIAPTNKLSASIFTLFFSQVVFAILFVAGLVVTQLFLLFAAPVLVFYNIVFGVSATISSFVFFKKQPTDVSFAFGKRIAYFFFLILGIGLMNFWYATLNGEAVGGELREEIAFLMGDVSYGERLEHDEKDLFYARIAAKKQDPEICMFVSSEERTSCFRKADPNNTEAVEECDLYNNYETGEPDYYGQAKCVFLKYALDDFYNKTLLCSELIEKYKDNPVVLNDKSCENLERLQNTLLTGSAEDCAALDLPKGPRHLFPGERLCQGFFDVNERACKRYKKSEYEYVTYQCGGLDTERHRNQMGDTFIRFYYNEGEDFIYRSKSKDGPTYYDGRQY